MVKLSIIVPVYNQEKYLDECICSLLEQNYEEYEIILINDGSSDTSAEICSCYLNNDKIKYIRQHNKGLGPARNVGLKVAAGKYVMFVDADDALEKNSLSELIGFVERNNLDIAYFDEQLCAEDMRVSSINATFPKMCTEISKVDALRYCMQPSHICARIYRINLFDNVEFGNMWYEDMESFPKLLSQAAKIGYYKVPLYKYRQHDAAITHNDSDIRNKDVMRAWNSAIKIEGLTLEEKKAVYMAVLNSIVTFCFFKSRFAKDYLAWYENYLGEIQSEIVFENFELENEYPFKQQAKAKSANTFYMIERVEQAYIEGGCVQIGGSDTNKTICAKKGLYFQLVGHQLKLAGINMDSKSAVLGAVLKEIQNQNLISMRGDVKENLLEKVIMDKGLQYNCYICIL